MEEYAFKKAEMDRELRSARGWLLAVGILMFAMDMLQMYVLLPSKGAIDTDLRMKFTLVAVGLLAVFVALWFFSKKKPVLCLTLGLVIFWAIQLLAAALEGGTSIFSGIIIKVLFTAALIKGIKSASRAEELSKELGKVFE